MAKVGIVDIKLKAIHRRRPKSGSNSCFRTSFLECFLNSHTLRKEKNDDLSTARLVDN
jgi:hypothetical protein